MTIIFSSCRTAYPSIFSGKLNLSDCKIINIADPVKAMKHLVLKNQSNVFIIPTDSGFLSITFFLKTPPLHNSPITSGVEKATINYLADKMYDEFNNIDKNYTYKIKNYGDKDLSYISLTTDNPDYIKIVDLFINSLKIKNFETADINKVIKNLRNDLTDKLKNSNYLLDYKSESIIFLPHTLDYRYDGTLFSLNLLKPDDVIKYYNKNIYSSRMMLLISGQVESKNFSLDYFNENYSFPDNPSESESYKPLLQSFFNKKYRFLINNNESDIIVKGYFKSPSFNNDDYFAFLMTLKILETNLNRNSSEYYSYSIESKMINSINYSILTIKSKSDYLVYSLLSFQRALNNLKSGVGYYYYFDEKKLSFIEEYKKQTEQNKIILPLKGILPNIKKEIYRKYNFSDINSFEKEVRFAKTFFLLGYIVDNQIVKNKIDLVNENNIMRCASVYFNNIAWNTIGKKEYLELISEDYFYKY